MALASPAVIETVLRRAIARNDVVPLVDRKFFASMVEPWPHYVHYRAPGKPFYCPPDKFGFVRKPGPSDCDWIVPGTC